jgi:hypothetical protein
LSQRIRCLAAGRELVLTLPLGPKGHVIVVQTPQRLLDAAEFKATFAEPMRDVSQTASDVIDIWPYADAIPSHDLFGYELGDGSVERIYRDGSETYDHVLVVTRSKNVFLVVVVDLRHDRIFGHHPLDLNQEYGLVTAN